MTDTITPTFTPGMTSDAMRAQGAAAVLRTVREQWLEWCAIVDQPHAWPTRVLDDEFMSSQLQFHWRRDLDNFSAWAQRNPDKFTAAPVPYEPIGPSTPGWDAFWERVAELAEEGEYQEQYNKLAIAFGAATIDDPVNEDVEVVVEMSVSMPVTVRITMTRGEYDSGEYEIEQSDIDDAINDYVRNNNADYEVIESYID